MHDFSALIQEAAERFEVSAQTTGFIRTRCPDGIVRFLPTLSTPEGHLLIVGYNLFPNFELDPYAAS